jgi:hypothetical protein
MSSYRGGNRKYRYLPVRWNEWLSADSRTKS